ncbi:MAG: hypothetical protein IJ792_04425, partial [Oscillospiraceae bacterium]|nr:hypothetical protein [Oscillospiraceae bacterium]
RTIIDAAYDKCRSILHEHMDALERTAQYLLEHETMSALEFERIFDPNATEAAESDALSRFAGEKKE